MTEQKKHVRVSKKGKKFVAGNKKQNPWKVVAAPGEAMIFKKYIAFMSDIRDDANFLFTSNGIEALEMSHDNVSMYKIHIKPTRAIGKVNLSSPIKKNIDIKALKSAYSSIGAKDNIKLLSNAKEEVILITNSNGKNTTIPQTAPKKSNLKEPSLDFKYKFKVSGKEFMKALKEISKATKEVTIFGSVSGISLNSKDSKVRIALGEKIKGDELQFSTYVINRFKPLYHILPLYNNVEVSFSKDYPIEILLNNEIADVKLIFAPKFDKNEK